MTECYEALCADQHAALLGEAAELSAAYSQAMLPGQRCASSISELGVLAQVGFFMKDWI